MTTQKPREFWVAKHNQMYADEEISDAFHVIEKSYVDQLEADYTKGASAMIAERDALAKEQDELKGANAMHLNAFIGAVKERDALDAAYAIVCERELRIEKELKLVCEYKRMAEHKLLEVVKERDDLAAQLANRRAMSEGDDKLIKRLEAQLAEARKQPVAFRPPENDKEIFAAAMGRIERLERALAEAKAREEVLTLAANQFLGAYLSNDPKVGFFSFQLTAVLGKFKKERGE